MYLNELVEKVKDSMKKEEYDYFAFFCDMITCAGQAAELLEKALITYDREKISENIKEIHAVEHSADLIKHAMLEKLLKEFLPPIDREDIIELAHVLDNVVDNIEDVVQHIGMFNIVRCRGEAIGFVRIIKKCCAALADLLAGFKDFKKNTAALRKRIIEINSLEEEGDALYSSAMRTLFTDGTSGAELVAWKELFARLENCCDECEHVADVVEEVLMKNA